VPERASHALSIDGLHSLKCSMILSSYILFSSLSSMMTSWASMSFFLSQFILFSLVIGEVRDNWSSWLWDVGVSIIFYVIFLLNSLFYW
jgi:hypothetical protein